MPRAKKGPDVAFKTHGQPVNTPTGLPYGEAKTLQDAQSAVPLAGPADLTSVFKAPAPVTTAQGGEPPSQLAPQGTNNDLLTATQNYNPVPIGLMGQSNRPNEPVTAGLSSGPGSGPAALNLPPGSAGATLYALAQATGDEVFYDLAEQAMRAGQ